MQTNQLLFVVLFLILPIYIIAGKAFSINTDPLSIQQLTWIEDAKDQYNVQTALDQLRNADSQKIQGDVFNKGLVQTHYWLYTELSNSTTHSLNRYLLVSVPYRALLKVHLIEPDKDPRLILNESLEHSFNQRVRNERFLSSSKIEMAPGQTKSLLIEYQAVGSSYLPFQMVSETELAQIIFDDSVNAAYFYSFSIAAIIVFLLFALAMMNRVSAMYGVLFLIGLLLIASVEGFAFKYLWPQAPAWNNLSPLVLLYILSGFGLWLSAQATLETSRFATLARPMKWLGSLCFAMVPLCFVLPFVLLLNIASLLMVLMFVSQALAITSWIQLSTNRNAIALGASLLLAIFVFILLLETFDIALFPEAIYLSAPRIVYTVASLATMATIIMHVGGLRRDHEKALENELVLVKREAETNKALFEAEQNFSRAKEVAHLRQEQLARASHDMRQPLVSLRATMDAIAANESEQTRTQFRNAFDYLEGLCNNYLAKTHPENEQQDWLHADEQVAQTKQRSEAVEPYPISLIINTNAQMFADEAKQKGLEFRCHGSELRIDKPPLIVMRIITNLLSNAIKHTNEGKILLGARRYADRVSIQVLDTGNGMSEEQISSFSQAYQKGVDSEGEGLGLAICYQLAEQNGMTLSITSTPGKGTCCKLDISRT